MLKLIVKHAHKTIKQRVVPAQTIAAWTEKIENMEEDIQDIALQERAEKAVNEVYVRFDHIRC